jgi:hypothetical protein
MTTDSDDTELSSPHISPTDHLLTELQLYGHRPFQDEPDPRPLPEANVIAGAVADIFEALIATLRDTRLEPDLEDLLWSTVNLFHRATDRVQRELDDNEDAQKRSQKEQDGSEIRSVELERLVAEGLTLIERRNSTELFRDLAADQFERHTGSPWRARTGSMVNHRTLTAAMIDSRDFLAAKRRVEIEPLLPAGPKIIHRRPRLQRPSRDLGQARQGSRQASRHGASPRWIPQRRRTHRGLLGQQPQRPADHVQARLGSLRQGGTFKRNDQLLDVMPIGVIVFPGSGISANLADKAKKLGIPVWKSGGA